MAKSALILLTRWWALYMTASAPAELDELDERVEATPASLPDLGASVAVGLATAEIGVATDAIAMQLQEPCPRPLL